MDDLQQPGGVEQIRIMRLEPGDVVVVHVQMSLSAVQRASIINLIRSRVGDYPVIIMEGGSRLEVLRRERALLAET